MTKEYCTRKEMAGERGDERSWGCILIVHVRKTVAHFELTEHQWIIAGKVGREREETGGRDIGKEAESLQE